MSAMLREPALLKQLKNMAEIHARELRAYEATVQNLEQRIDELTGVRLTVGDGLEVYGTYEAIRRAQAFILIDSSHPVEAKDTARHFASALQVAEQRIRQLEAQSVAVVGEPVGSTDRSLRKLWREAGGCFFGPIVETGSMPESDLLPFLRSLIQHDAAELATLREKAVRIEQVEKERDEANARLHDVSVACATAEQERDELQKRAERMQKALSDIAEWTDRYTTPGHPVSTIASAAIAQGKGE